MSQKSLLVHTFCSLQLLRLVENLTDLTVDLVAKSKQIKVDYLDLTEASREQQATC